MADYCNYLIFHLFLAILPDYGSTNAGKPLQDRNAPKPRGNF